jgi:uncharacterized protein with GYD domain
MSGFGYSPGYIKGRFMIASGLWPGALGGTRTPNHRSVGIGASSRTVHCGPCAGPTFQSRPRASAAVQWLGNSLGYSRDGMALILDRLLSSRTYPKLARIVRALCAVAGRCCQPLANLTAAAWLPRGTCEILVGEARPTAGWIKAGGGEFSVPTYLIQLAYTPDAWAAMVKQPQNRLEAVRPMVEKLGGKFQHAWLAFGEYDIVGVIELPENTDAAAFAMAVGAGGAAEAFKTTPLLSVEEGIEAMRKAQGAGYRPPS